MAQENNKNSTPSNVIEKTNDQLIIFKSIPITSPVKLTFDDIFPNFDRKRIQRMPNSYKIFRIKMSQEFNKKHGCVRPSIISSIATSEWRKLPEHAKREYNYSSRYMSELYNYRFKPFTYQIAKF